MKHPSNRELFEHWNARRGARLAPERNDIEPAAIRKILGDTFVLEANGSAPPTFRLAGTRLCALFARELKGEGFNQLWHRSGQTAIRELLAVVMDEKVAETFEAPTDNPIERLMYAASVLHCLPVGRTEAPSAATGTVMRPAVFTDYAHRAGFTSVDVLPIEHDLFRFYQLTV